MSGYKTQSSDTSIEVERLLIERYRAILELGVLKVQRAALDLSYLRDLAARVGLTDLLERALDESRAG